MAIEFYSEYLSMKHKIEGFTPKVRKELRLLENRFMGISEDCEEDHEERGKLWQLYGNMDCDRKFYNTMRSICEGRPAYTLARDEELQGDWSREELSLPMRVPEVPSICEREREWLHILTSKFGFDDPVTLQQLQLVVIARRLVPMHDEYTERSEFASVEQRLVEKYRNDRVWLQAVRSLYIAYPQAEYIARPLNRDPYLLG
jgi:hypothetical protein